MSDAQSFDRVAMIVQRLAVLMAAGIAPLPAWQHVAAGGSDERVGRVLEGTSTAHDLPGRIAAVARDGPAPDTAAWGALAAVWTIATESGAPLGPTLERSAEVLRSLARSARDVEVALAGPMATSRVVLALPLVAVLLGMLLGFDLAGAFASVPGFVCLGLGALLIVTAVRWTRRLLRWARDLDATPGLHFELLAVALAGGMSVERAARLVTETCDGIGVELPTADVDGVLDFARSAGVPVVGLLRAESDEARRRASTAAADRAARLEARLLLPLGICVLPAFVVLGVVPIAISILSSTVGSL